MSDFRILQHAATGALRFVDRAVDTHIVDDVAHLAVTKTKGMTNPLHILGTGVLDEGIFHPTIYERVTTNVLRGTGSSALDDAVRSLHNLGRRHGVDGISLTHDPNHYGLIKLSNSGVYESGRNILTKLGKGDIEAGRAVAHRIDNAARRVLDHVLPPR